MLHRSSLLLAFLLACPSAEWPVLANEKPTVVTADSVVAYVLSCRKANGAFGPIDQEYTDAAWNYPAVHTLRLLGAGISDVDRVLAHGLGYPAGHAGYGHWLVYHQTLTRWLLAHGTSVPESATNTDRSAVRLVHQGFAIRYYGSPFGTGGDHFFKADGVSTARQFGDARELGYYNLSSLYYMLAALHADGRHVSNPDELIKFILKRQAPNGGFVDIRADDAQPGNSETHIAHTYHAVASLKLLNTTIPHADRCAVFARQCQATTRTSKRDASFGIGGFLFDADIARPGNYPDVYYTLAGLQVLSLLDAKPVSVPECIRWVNDLQNHDGGFGDRPGWRSRLYSTYYAVHSLALLSQMAGSDATPLTAVIPHSGNPLAAIAGKELFGPATRMIPTKELSVTTKGTPLGKSLRIHQGLFKTPVVKAGDLAGLKKRGLNLLAMKTDDFTIADALLETGEEASPSLEVVLCPEAYPHRLRRHGEAVLHHVGNFTLDPRWSESQRAIWRAADESGKMGLPWSDYQQQVLRPLQQLGSLCYPEQDFELEYAYSAYDDGLYGRGGYNAIQVGFNWSPRDFVRVFPWRERYTDKLPPVADADAHGDLAKWSPQLDHTRHLYISKSASYSDFQDAARNGRVVCVVVGVENVAPRITYYGVPEAVHFVKARVAEWKWW